MTQIQTDPKKVNEVKIAGVISEQQVTPTFKKQVLKIRAKDTKDQQWKDAEIEVYIKPELYQRTGAAIGDTVLIEGWLAFNFWNDRSFPRIVVTKLEVLEKAQTQQTQQSNQSVIIENNFPDINDIEQVPQASQAQQQIQQSVNETVVPDIPDIPMPPM